MKQVTARASVIPLILALAISASPGHAQPVAPAMAEPEPTLPSLHELLQPGQPAKSGECTVVADAQMPLVASFGRFTTPVITDEQPLMMLVDSGAGGSALSPRTAASLHLETDTDRRVRLNGVGGQLDVQYPVILHSLRFGSVTLENYDVLTANIERPERENDAAAPVGLIGTDLLSRFDVELDLPNHRMTLYRVSSCSGNFIPRSGRHDTFMASVAATRHSSFRCS
jgi:Aspartyl protease